MSAVEWDEKWGTKADHNIEEARTEHEGIKVGDRIEVTEDNEDEGYFAGDEGIVLGISVTAPGTFNPHERTEFVVLFDGQDPIGVSPDDVAVAS